MVKTCYYRNMKLKKYVEEHGRDSLAKEVGISSVYVWQLANRKRMASPRVAKAIHVATDRVVSLAEIRPDIWGNES